MLETLPNARLKTREIVSVAIVHAPDADWAPRLEPMLVHKGDPWIWQNAELLRWETGLAVRFFVLHRGGRPFACIMLADSAGVALLGHVWTEPADREKGASGILMDLVLERFHGEGGRAVFLTAEPQIEAIRYYERRGFAAIEPGSGCMAVIPEGMPAFFGSWLAGQAGPPEPLDWVHWPALAPLCAGDFPGVVRLASTGLIGRGSSEAAFLPVIRRQRTRAAGEGDRACAIRNPAGAVLGFATLMPDPMWPEQDVLDVFCHPLAWNRAAEMVSVVGSSSTRACVAYVDDGGTEKSAVLKEAGFGFVATLRGWLKTGADVDVWRRAAA